MAASTYVLKWIFIIAKFAKTFLSTFRTAEIGCSRSKISRNSRIWKDKKIDVFRTAKHSSSNTKKVWTADLDTTPTIIVKFKVLIRDNLFRKEIEKSARFFIIQWLGKPRSITEQQCQGWIVNLFSPRWNGSKRRGRAVLSTREASYAKLTRCSI